MTVMRALFKPASASRTLASATWMSALLFSAAAISASRLSGAAVAGLPAASPGSLLLAAGGWAVAVAVSTRAISVRLIVFIRMSGFLSPGKFQGGHEPVVVLR